MSHRCAHIAIAIASLAALAVPTFAQPALGPDLIKATSPPTEAQQRQIQAFVEELAATLTTGSDLEVAAARRALLVPFTSAPSADFAIAYSAVLRPALQKAVQSDRPLVRLNALIIAADVRDPGVTSLVQTGLADPVPAVRYEALRALEQFLRRAPADLAVDPNALQQRLLADLSRMVAKPQGHQLWRATLDALSAFTIPQARQQLAQILNQRVEAHAQQPNLTLEPERKALAQIFLYVVQASVQQQQSDPQLLRLLAVTAFRYLDLSATIAANGLAAETALAEHREMAVAAERILRWAVQTLAPAQPLPPTIDPMVKKGLWSDVLLQVQAWRQALTQPPLEIQAADLAVPEPQSATAPTA